MRHVIRVEQISLNRLKKLKIPTSIFLGGQFANNKICLSATTIQQNRATPSTWASYLLQRVVYEVMSHN